MVGQVARVSTWQYDVDIDYIKSIGGVAKCFNPKTRSGTPDVGAYRAGTVTTATPGSCVPPTTTGTEPTQPEQPAAAADAAPAASKEVPTEQDFEEKAASEVTKDNVESEVEKMEKEIGAQGGPAGGAAAPAAGGETDGQKK